MSEASKWLDRNVAVTIDFVKNDCGETERGWTASRFGGHLPSLSGPSATCYSGFSFPAAISWQLSTEPRRICLIGLCHAAMDQAARRADPHPRVPPFLSTMHVQKAAFRSATPAPCTKSDSTLGLSCGFNVLVMFSLTHQATATAFPEFLRACPAVHELRAPVGTAAHAGLAALLLGIVWGERPVLWVSAAPDWYPPGLAWAGVDPGCCLFARATDDAEALGSAEVALRGGMAAVAVCEALSRLAARRLALAAKQGGGLGLVLRHACARTREDSTAFASRWMVHPAPGNPHAPALRAELLYAKGAMPGDYLFALKEGWDAEAPLSLPGLRRAG